MARPALWPPAYGPSGPQRLSFPISHSSRTSRGSCTWSGNGRISCRSGCRTSSLIARAALVRDQPGWKAVHRPESLSSFLFLLRWPCLHLLFRLNLSCLLPFLYISLLGFDLSPHSLFLCLCLSPFCCVSSLFLSLCFLLLSGFFSLLSLVISFSLLAFSFSVPLPLSVSSSLSSLSVFGLSMSVSPLPPHIYSHTSPSVSKSRIHSHSVNRS